MPRQLVLADDLSGACEAGAAFLLRTTRITVHLGGAATTDDTVTVLDLDSRRASEAVATTTLTRALTAHPGTPALVKIDSLLRGHVDALVTAARSRDDALVVVCPASPGVGRVVRAGVVHVHDVPLHATDLWRAEPRPAPATVADALPRSSTVPVDLATVRGPRDQLRRALVEAASRGRVPVADAETDDDLDALVSAAAAAGAAGARPVLAGAGGLAAALARALPADPPTSAPPVPSDEPVLVVVGSVAPGLPAEVDHLRRLGAHVLDLSPADLLDDPSGAVAVPHDAAGSRLLVARLDPAAPVEPARGPALARAVAEAVAPLAPGRSLVLTGGETARAVLERVGVRSLRPLRQDRGAVTSTTDDGRAVVTRPGSFGTGASLAELVTTLTDRTTKESA
jgi:4-hydroxythreonine-4-phosphate dehydrogenase